MAHEPCDSFRCTAKGLSHTSCPKVFLPAWLPRSTEQSSLCLVVGQDPGHLDGTSSGRPCQPQPRFHFPGSSLRAFSLIYLFLSLNFHHYYFHHFACAGSSLLSEIKNKFTTGVSFFFLVNYFLVALDLRCCTQALSSCGEWGLLSSCGAQAAP